MHIEILIGLIGGILIGGTGAGVGSLITPLLILAGYRPAVAVSTGLGTLALSKLTGATLHHQLGNWPDRNVGIVVAGGAAGVVLTWLLTRSIVLTAAQQDSALKIMLGVTLVLAAISLQISNRDGHHGLIRDLEHRPGVLFVIGALVAFIVATTAAGSGSLLVTALLLTTAWRVPQLAAVSNLYGLVVGGLSFALHLQLGFDLRLFVLTTLGLVPGVIAGSLLSRSIARQWFARAIGLVSIYLGVKLLATSL